jgi:hypothetical protein
MSFSTKLLFRLFHLHELHGRNVAGKTLNKNMKTKLALDPIRVGYIKFLVESWFDDKEFREMLVGTSNKGDMWKSCHTAINKAILISERKAMQRAEKKSADGEDEVSTNGVEDEADAVAAEEEREAEAESTASITARAHVSGHAEVNGTTKNDVYAFRDREDDEAGDDDDSEDSDVGYNSKSKSKVVRYFLSFRC